MGPASSIVIRLPIALIADHLILNFQVAMVRRILPFLAVLVLVLAGPARELLGAWAPQASCCCGEAGDPGEGTGPCGMPKAPCSPRCPHSAPGQTFQAPAARTAIVETAQRRSARRREPVPCPALRAQATTRTSAGPVQAARGWPPPPWPGEDPQAGLGQFRI